MRFNPGDPALVVGGSGPDHRPEDIGKVVEVVGWFKAGDWVRWPDFESDTNDTGEDCWAVILLDEETDCLAIAMKRDAWLMPILDDDVLSIENKRELVE